MVGQTLESVRPGAQQDVAERALSGRHVGRQEVPLHLQVGEEAVSIVAVPRRRAFDGRADLTVMIRSLSTRHTSMSSRLLSRMSAASLREARPYAPEADINHWTVRALGNK